ncbi:MAG TPA: TadE family protein [Terriglobales bacterium]|nr:TadE family protein [Terriglobales bacterium]
MNFRRLITRDESGAEMAELAFVLPLLFMLLFGIMWFGRAFQIYSTVNQAARAAAEAAAVPSCAGGSCGSPNTFYAQPCSGSACALKTNVVDPILQAAHLDPTQVQNFSSTSAAMNCAPPGPCSGPGPQETGVQVSFTYPYSFKLNGFTCCPPQIVPITNGITLTAQAQARTEQ